MSQLASNRSGVAGAITTALLLVAMPAFSQPAPHIGEGGLPQFVKDPAWPKVPAKWRMGFGSAVAVDERDHVWILSRPRTLAKPDSPEADLKSSAAPPVMGAGVKPEP